MNLSNVDAIIKKPFFVGSCDSLLSEHQPTSISPELLIYNFGIDLDPSSDLTKFSLINTS